MSDIITIGVIGLGNAGSPILNNLYKSKKYNIVAFDIDKNKLNDVSEDITKAISIKDLAGKCSVVLTCLPKPEHVLEAVDGKEGLVRDTSSGGAIINTNRNAYEIAKRRAAEAQKQRDEIRGANREINNLKCEMHEIKSMLKTLLERD